MVVEALLEYHVELDTLRKSLDSEKVALSPPRASDSAWFYANAGDYTR